MSDAAVATEPSGGQAPISKISEAVIRIAGNSQDGIQAIGGIVLIVFGAMLCKARPPVAAVEGEAQNGQISDYLSDVPKAFLMTVTNPGAVLGLFAIFGGIGTFVEVRGAIDAMVLVAAIMAGSLLWWVMLAAIPALLATACLPLERDEGRRQAGAAPGET